MEELRRIANDDVVALGDEVRAIDLDIEMPGADPQARDDLGVALDRYDRAQLALKSARRPQDFAPVSTALEEGRWAMESAKARLDGRTPPERRPPCFFDPRHGPSTRDVEWSPDGYPAREVPACEADAVRIESGEEPLTREVELAGQRMPYYAGPRWMGPYSGGYYGGFGGFGAGLFGGMILGDLMGDGFGGGYAYGADGGGAVATSAAAGSVAATGAAATSAEAAAGTSAAGAATSSRRGRAGVARCCCQGQRPSSSTSSVKLRNVRTSTTIASTPTLVNVGSTAIVRMMSAATRNSRPSRIARPPAGGRRHRTGGARRRPWPRAGR